VRRTLLLALLAGCVRTVSAPPRNPPPEPLASRGECERALGRVLELYGDEANVSPEGRDEWLDTCAGLATRREVRCVLEADTRDKLAQCGGTL
jgi:hypothetical protein